MVVAAAAAAAAAATAWRLRARKMQKIRKARKERPEIVPMAMPALAPGVRPLRGGTRSYFRAKSWLLITLTRAVGLPVEEGGTRGSGGEV